MTGRVPPRPADAVRVLHTSDWHLGVSVRNEPRRVDHDAVVAEIVDIAGAAQPDLIVHTGDLFDGHRPAMQEFGRAITALRSLAEVAPVVLLAGNHDSPVALDVLGLAVDDDHHAQVEAGAFDPLTPSTQRIRIHPKPTLAERGAVTTYATRSGARLRLVALPFVHQNRVIKEFGDLVEANATYNDSLRKIVASYSGPAFTDFDPTTDVAVFASHLHIRDARTSSEKTIHIAEDYATDPAHFEPRYGYLAFGHIHVPQAVADGRGRYAGSILEVDFGEEGEEKQVVLVDLVAGRPTKVTPIALTAGRRLHRLRAPLSEVPDHASRIADGIVEVTVTAEPVVQEQLALDGGPAVPSGATDRILVGGQAFDTLSSAVRAVLPDATVVGVIDARSTATAALDELAAPATTETLGDTFRAWLSSSGAAVMAASGSGDADPERIVGLFEELHAAVTTDAPVDLVELAALEELTASPELEPSAGSAG